MDGGVSIVDYLKAVGVDSSLASRKTHFEAAFPGEGGQYTGTAEQNLRLLAHLRMQAAVSGDKTRKQPAPVVDGPMWCAVDTTTKTLAKAHLVKQGAFVNSDLNPFKVSLKLRAMGKTWCSQQR